MIIKHILVMTEKFLQDISHIHDTNFALVVQEAQLPTCERAQLGFDDCFVSPYLGSVLLDQVLFLRE